MPKSLSRALDQAVARENRRAIEDARCPARSGPGHWFGNGTRCTFCGTEDEPVSSLPKYPAGTPEYEAYAAELRAELAKWKNREFPYVLEA